LANGQQRVDRSDSNIQWLSDGPPLQRIRLAVIPLTGTLSRRLGAPIQRTAQTIDHPTEQRPVGSQLTRRVRRQHFRPWDQAGGIVKSQQPSLAVFEANDLAVNTMLRVEFNAAPTTDRSSATASGQAKAVDFGQATEALGRDHAFQALHTFAKMA